MNATTNPEARLRTFYRTLERVWGPQHWWPARTRFEVIIGAYLTQNTAWSNVELALANLRRERVLSVAGIRKAPVARLEQLIRPAGYFRQKAARLKTFVSYLDQRYGGALKRMFAAPTAQLREELLALNGVGPETADSILLYAGNHPVFVVDAYTRRMIERHGIFPANADYEDIRGLFERSLGASQPAICQTEASDPPKSVLQPASNRFEREGRNGRRGGDRLQAVNATHDLTNENDGVAADMPVHINSQDPRFTTWSSSQVRVFNEMHALIVSVGKRHCFKKDPDCAGCPLRLYLPE